MAVAGSESRSVRENAGFTRHLSPLQPPPRLFPSLLPSTAKAPGELGWGPLAAVWGGSKPKLIKSPWVASLGAPGRGEGGAHRPGGAPPARSGEKGLVWGKAGEAVITGHDSCSRQRVRKGKLARAPCGVLGTIPGPVIRHLANQSVPD